MPISFFSRAVLSQVIGVAGIALVGVGATPPGVASAQDSRVFDTSAGPIAVTRVAGPFENPWAVAFLPDGRLLVTERPGRIQLVDGDRITEVAGAPAVEDIGQGGLLDLVIAPDFAESGVVYFSYAKGVGGGAFSDRQTTAVARAELVLDQGAPRLAGVEDIFLKEPAVDSARHFGSRIVIADDGALFIALGDRANRPRAQDLDTHIGKIVRIAPDGAAPADNPFSGEGDGALDEIWSYGHRNIQGAALRPSDRSLWTIEHGARGGDEVNHPEPGKNYGWPVISYGRHYSGGAIGEGTAKEGMEQPVYYWDPSIAPSGMAFYDGDLIPEWRGDIFSGALRSRLIARLELDGDRVVDEERLFQGAFGRIRDVRSGPDGALWFVTDESDGAVYRAAPPGE